MMNLRVAILESLKEYRDSYGDMPHGMLTIQAIGEFTRFICDTAGLDPTTGKQIVMFGFDEGAKHFIAWRAAVDAVSHEDEFVFSEDAKPVTDES
jgi:hypothetical protein